ncbi:hypothetical protein [Massilia sp. H6]|uniref:hypothetical protein n=1 Tax=Massilia sp. H6 TaxID=2970464 RepID=UPI0021696608|nr:hypothetical protein [Massilia sp. H6]UVW29860.1 hypothetical protein NRS07_06985 [Massilia sp. H6]
MGFILGSVWISIFSFMIAVVVVRPMFALLFPRRKVPSLLETFKVTAGWVSVGLLPAMAYTVLVQWLLGDALRNVMAVRFPNAPADVEPIAVFGFIYIMVATVLALLILSHDHIQGSL